MATCVLQGAKPYKKNDQRMTVTKFAKELWNSVVEELVENVGKGGRHHTKKLYNDLRKVGITLTAGYKYLAKCL